MSSESPQVSPIAPNRLSSVRLSGLPTSPSRSSTPTNNFMPPSLSSRHGRAMTAGELYNAMEQEQEVLIALNFTDDSILRIIF